MKNNRKALLLVLCAVMMITASIFGTLAYLTDTKTATNTFTVGSVTITLDETDVDTMGVKDGETRVTPTAEAPQLYHLLPGHEYIKDPIVHVDANSESCYVFVEVVNNIAAFEDSANTIAAQIAVNGWTPLTGKTGVFYQEFTKGQDDKDLEVFGKFKISGTANNVDGWSAITNEGNAPTVVTVTAYAIQKDGFEDAAAAWGAGDKNVSEGGWNN